MLARVNGEARDLRLPLPEGASLEILTTRDRDDPDALAVLRHSAAHLLAEAVRRLHPGVKVAIGPPIENGFYYDFEFPEPIREEDLAAIEARGRSASSTRAGRGSGRRSARDEARVALRGRGRAVQGRARRHRRRRHLALHAGRLHRSLPRPAPPGLVADQGVQAHGPRRRLLARRREEHAADPDLRHGVLQPGRPRRLSRAARAGARERPPAARAAARPVPLRRALAGLAVLASEGDDADQRARGRPSARERAARLLEVRTPIIYDKSLWETSGHWEKFRGEHVPRSRSTSSTCTR